MQPYVFWDMQAKIDCISFLKTLLCYAYVMCYEMGVQNNLLFFIDSKEIINCNDLMIWINKRYN